MLNLEKVIEVLAEEAKKTNDATDALKLSQSALNLANTMATLHSINVQ